MSKEPEVRAVYLVQVRHLFPVDFPRVDSLLFEYCYQALEDLLEYIKNLDIEVELDEFLVVIVPPDQLDHYRAKVLAHYDGEACIFTHPNVTAFRVFCVKRIPDLKPQKRIA